MSDIIETLWNIANQNGLPITKTSTDKAVTLAISGNRVVTISNDVFSLAEGFHLFTNLPNTNIYKVNTHPIALRDIKADIVIRSYYMRCNIPIITYPEAFSIDVNDIPAVVINALVKSLERTHNLNDIFKDYNISLKLQPKQHLKVSDEDIKNYTSASIEECFKKISFVVNPETESSDKVVEGEDLFLGFVIKNSANEGYVLDLGDMFDSELINIHEVSDAIRYTGSTEVTKRVKPSDFISKTEINKSLVKSAQSADDISDMRRLSRALDKHTDGRISIKTTNTIEVSAMLSKLIKAVRQQVGPIDATRELTEQLLRIYDEDSIKHVLNTEGDSICIRGVLYIRHKPNLNFYVKVATLSNGTRLYYNEHELIDSLLEDYSSKTIAEYLTQWINVNDLAQRY